MVGQVKLGLLSYITQVSQGNLDEVWLGLGQEVMFQSRLDQVSLAQLSLGQVRLGQVKSGGYNNAEIEVWEQCRHWKKE